MCVLACVCVCVMWHTTGEVKEAEIELVKQFIRANVDDFFAHFSRRQWDICVFYVLPGSYQPYHCLCSVFGDLRIEVYSTAALNVTPSGWELED